jgi:hypothetical protein
VNWRRVLGNDPEGLTNRHLRRERVKLMEHTDHADDEVSAEVLDAITDALADTSGPAARAVVVHRLVLEIYDTVQWLHAPDVADDELLSVSPLLTEALRHRRRMATIPDRASAPGTAAASVSMAS